jgi:hypothetical protein
MEEQNEFGGLFVVVKGAHYLLDAVAIPGLHPLTGVDAQHVLLDLAFVRIFQSDGIRSQMGQHDAGDVGRPMDGYFRPYLVFLGGGEAA